MSAVRSILLFAFIWPASPCWAQPAGEGAPGVQRSDLWNSIEAHYRTPAAMQRATQRRLSAEERALLREQVRGYTAHDAAHMAAQMAAHMTPAAPPSAAAGSANGAVVSMPIATGEAPPALATLQVPASVGSASSTD
ncbi:MAG: hypothetical protein ACFNZS_04210 [Ottowia sp.]|uniref:hypothetical protein n=1 Tax=Ottowia TaxID=219181 RepID=UPI0011AF83E0|nr:MULTISPECIES: hypothetical protein [Ottowia]